MKKKIRSLLVVTLGIVLPMSLVGVPVYAQMLPALSHDMPMDMDSMDMSPDMMSPLPTATETPTTTQETMIIILIKRGEATPQALPPLYPSPDQTTGTPGMPSIVYPETLNMPSAPEIPSLAPAPLRTLVVPETTPTITKKITTKKVVAKKIVKTKKKISSKSIKTKSCSYKYVCE